MLSFVLNCPPERSSEYFRIILPDLFKTSQKANLSVLWSAAFVWLFRTAKREENSPPEKKKRDRTRNAPPCLSPISDYDDVFERRTGIPPKDTEYARPEGGRRHARSGRWKKLGGKPSVLPCDIIAHFLLPVHSLFFPASAPERHHRSLTASCPANSTLLFVSDFP